MNVKEIVSKYLVENGFDGLFNFDEECSCGLDDLCTCDAEIADCQSGYRLPGDEDHDFLIGPEKPEGE